MRNRLLAMVAALALAALTLAAFDGFTIKRSPKAGETHKYRQTGKFELPGQTFEFEAIATDKVTNVDANGNYSIEEATSNFKLNGNESPDAPSTVTTTYSPKGEIIDLKTTELTSAGRRLANLAVFIVPDKDVRVGDTWTYDIKPDAKNEVPGLACKYILLGEEKVNGLDALKIKFSLKEAKSDPASTEGTIWLGRADSLLLKMTTKLINAPAPGPAGEVTVTGDLSLTLLP